MKKIKKEKELFNPFLDIFKDENECYKFLLERKVLKEAIQCPSCGLTMKATLLSSNVDLRVFKCKNKNCKNQRSIKSGSKFEGLQVGICAILRVFYCYVLDFNIFQGINVSKVSKGTYVKIKDLITNMIKETEDKIGGVNLEVQLDETAICNGLIINNPSSFYDDHKDIQWILGGIDNSSEKNFFLDLVPDRKSLTLLRFFEKNIKQGSLLISDGYPSYPKAAQLFGSELIVVNHTEGFVNDSGYTTNSIENLWSHLKKEYRDRAGISKERIRIFLKEFSWKKRNLKEKTENDLFNTFILLVDYFRCN